MKIALCLFGKIGGTVGKDMKGETLDFKLAHSQYMKHIIDLNDVDIFIHSWSQDYKDDLMEIYNPKKAEFQKQKRFAWFNDKAHRAGSRWFSSKRVIELKKEFEQEKDIVYDWVMVSRLDVAFFTDVVFSDFNSNYFYASHWNAAPDPTIGRHEANMENYHVGNGFLDFWFFSNSHMMDKFGGLFDNRKKYDLSPHSASRQHVDTFTDKIRYVFYRWIDHEMVRRYYYKSGE
jgi:hypothetical protein